MGNSEIAEAVEQGESKSLSESLFENAMKGRWHKVVDKYKADTDSHTAKLTASEDTALHLAVSGGKHEVVEEMVKSLGGKDSEILKQKNARGNTPLHTAAELGYSYMCHCMASSDPSLIAKCNKEEKTPLFLAAQFGHEETFLCLYFLSVGKPLDIRSRDAKGDNFLHAALKGEFFSLAFQIIRKYPELVNGINEDGFTPLHILATKPYAFKSGSRLGLFDRIIYRCITVYEIREVQQGPTDYLKRFKRIEDPWYPQNYGTCAHFFQMLFGVIFYGVPWEKIGSSKVSCFHNNDEENASQKKNPPQMSNNNHGKVNGYKEEDEKDSIEQRYLPPNYATLIQSLKFLMNLLVVVLELGFQRIKKIKIKKKRHAMALQVMNELIEKTSLYKFIEGRTSGGESDIFFDPRITGAAQGVEADKTGGTFEIEQHQLTGSSNKEGIVAPMESFLKECSITGTVDSKSSKHAVKMALQKKVAYEPKTETPILIAARMGVTEMVESMLQKFPVMIQDLDANNKNVLLLAVENRQTHTFQFLIERKIPLRESVFRQQDDKGNNALHLAARYGEYLPWFIPRSPLQIQWELKWYKFVRRCVSWHLLVQYNHNNQTPEQIFMETHKPLVKEGREWLTKASESCSFIAALIATVAFATSATIPGGVKEATGKPVLEDEPAFAVFSISSLVALCSSLIALVCFLAIITSRFTVQDFASTLPWKLMFGLTALLTSIAAILVSFFAGHFFELRDKLKIAAFPIYGVTCFSVSFFAIAQLPLYFDLLRATIIEIPQPANDEFTD